MKKEDVPQDLSSLGKITNEVCYAVDGSGKYVKELSRGWEVKIKALDVAWDDIEIRMAAAKEKVIKKEASPLLFFMERALMDVAILAGYTGFWKFEIKRHLRPEVFERLSEAKLKRYATVFNVSIQNLKSMTINEA